jgi:hypothetical protein
MQSRQTLVYERDKHFWGFGGSPNQAVSDIVIPNKGRTGILSGLTTDESGFCLPAGFLEKNLNAHRGTEFAFNVFCLWGIPIQYELISREAVSAHYVRK